MQQPDNLYPLLKSAIEGKRLPMAVLMRSSFEANIQYFLRKSENKKIRVASKSLRCRGLLAQLKDSLGQKYSGLMCFTAEETLWLSQNGHDDLLLAYPCWNEEQIKKLAEEVKVGKKIYLMVDSIDHIERIEAISRACDIRFPLCIDLDVSLKLPFLNFGVYRSPIDSIEKFQKLVAKIKTSSHVELKGLMAYEAQVAGVPDNQKGKFLMNPIVRFLKKLSIGLIAKRRAACVQLCKDAGIQLDFVNGGGTGSLKSTCAEEAVTEVTIGSGFYTPTLFDKYYDLKSLPAFFYAVEVTRKPAPGIYTCLGGGYVASGSLGEEKLPKPFLPKDAKLISTEMAGEVQTPIQCDQTPLELGDPVFMRHAKAGELCEHFLSISLIESDGSIKEVLPTYRGEGQSFL